MRKRVVCGGVCIFLFIGLGIFTLVGLDSIINQAILDGVVLDPVNYELWGQNPGSSGVLTLRNFTFYNFTNPRGYLYRGETPVFTEVSNFAYQEKSNFTDYFYSEDKSILYYNFWLYFTVLESSRNVNETVTVMNLAPLGFWNQLDTVDISALAIQGFGGLYVEMNNTIKIQAIGQGVAGQYLPDKSTWQTYCTIFEFNSDICELLWSDPFYGLSDQNHY